MIFDFFSNSTFNFNTEHDWEALKKQGTVTESTEEKDGFKTITRTFISTDGSAKITSSESFPIIDETKQKVIELEKEIKLAVKSEDYEKAAKLKKEKEQLIQNKK
jgi:excinuclease UvrABC helicase subunit UvrB